MSGAPIRSSWPEDLSPGTYEIGADDVVFAAGGETVADLAADPGEAQRRARHTAAHVRRSGCAHRYCVRGAGGPIELSFAPGEEGRVHLTVAPGSPGPTPLSPPVLQAAIAAASDVVLVTDDAALAAEGPRVLYVNEAYVRATGRAATEVVGRPLRAAEVDEPGQGELLARMRRGERSRVEVRHRRKDGSFFWMESELAPVADETGWTAHWVIVGRDTSARRVREALRVRAGKLESLGLLGRGIAQEFNELLTGVLADCEAISTQAIAASGGAPPAELADAARSIAQAVEQARALTKQLSALAQGHEVVRRPVDLAALVRAALESGLRDSAVSATVEAVHPLHVLGDEAQLREVFTNLVTNARQAMHDRGEVEISVRPVFVAHEGGLSLRPGAYAEVAVRDAGPGIPSELLGRVFDPYFTTTPEGNGLGLALVDSIVHHHGGHVEAHSVPGSGAMFCVYLPLATGGPAGRGRALCVDADPQIRAMLERMLAAQGWIAEGAADGESALARCQAAAQQGASFDLVLIDAAPRRGEEPLASARALRSLFADLAIVLMTGTSLPAGTPFEPGLAQALLEKPFDAEALRAAVDRASPPRLH